LISNSRAAANEVRELLRVPAGRVTVIPNAVDIDRINRLAGEVLNDHWFSKCQCPLIVSVGSLTARKDVGTLIKALAIVKAKRDVRLAIIGKGYGPTEVRRIERLIIELGLEATDCPGDTAELLGHGKWGRLVPVGDPERMAIAILAALDDESPPDGRSRAADFSPASTAGAYLKVLLPALGSEAPVARPSA
jgi:glycosyltransferase involved in cell wall biosynthesis